MRYYKLSNETGIIAVCSSRDFLIFQEKHRIFLVSDEKYGQYISVNNKLYRDKWMNPETTHHEYVDIDIIEITQKEYNILYESLKTEEIVIPEEPLPVEEVIEELPDPDLEYVREIKIAEMRRDCNRAITNGVDYKNQHFSFTVEDQNNLRDALQYNTPIHADGEEFKVYDKSDVEAIYKLAKDNQIYQQKYFQKLKNYIMSLNDMEEIASVSYGMEV